MLLHHPVARCSFGDYHRCATTITAIVKTSHGRLNQWSWHHEHQQQQQPTQARIAWTSRPCQNTRTRGKHVVATVAVKHHGLHLILRTERTRLMAGPEGGTGALCLCLCLCLMAGPEGGTGAKAMVGWCKP